MQCTYTVLQENMLTTQGGNVLLQTTGYTCNNVPVMHNAYKCFIKTHFRGNIKTKIQLHVFLTHVSAKASKEGEV